LYERSPLRPIGIPRLICVLSLCRAIITRRFLQLLDVRCRQLWSINRQRELVELACELEWDLVVRVVYGGASVRPYVEILIPLQSGTKRISHL
jgi:hypothetical protein